MFSITNGRDAIHFEIARHFPKGDNQPFDEYFLRVWGQSGFISFDKQVDATRHDLQGFYNSLKTHFDSLKGTCKVPSLSYDEDFSIALSFDRTGTVSVSAELRSVDGFRNYCTLEFATDQTFMADTLRDMKTTFGF